MASLQFELELLVSADLFSVYGLFSPVGSLEILHDLNFKFTQLIIFFRRHMFL